MRATCDAVNVTAAVFVVKTVLTWRAAAAGYPSMMLLVRFGLVFWLFVRLIFAFEKIRARFKGNPYSLGNPPVLYNVLRNKKKVVAVWLGTPVTDTLCFRIRKERYFDQVAKVLGIATEFQTGDRKFDAHAYVLSEDQTLLRALAVDKELRQTVSELIAAGGSVRCNAGHVWVEFPAKALADRGAEDHSIVHTLAHQFASKLEKLRARLVAIRAESWSHERDPYAARERFFYIGAAVLVALAIVMFFWSMGVGFPRSLLFDNAERLALNTVIGASVLFIAAALYMFRGTSRLHLVLLEILLTMTPAAWYVGRTWYAEQNIRQDHSARQEETIRVVNHYSTRSRRRTSYYIVLERWPDSRIDTKLQIRYSLYSRTARGECVKVGYHRGRYGDPWADSIEPVTCSETW
jgi:hypothetical protein